MSCAMHMAVMEVKAMSCLKCLDGLKWMTLEALAQPGIACPGPGPL